MKKTYIKPFVEVFSAEAASLICDSNSVTTNNGEIKYGGVDEEGVKEPSARRYHDVWADEELEED